jgi:hypothetical protein
MMRHGNAMMRCDEATIRDKNDDMMQQLRRARRSNTQPSKAQREAKTRREAKAQREMKTQWEGKRQMIFLVGIVDMGA